jgi:hypothetical protein
VKSGDMTVRMNRTRAVAQPASVKGRMDLDRWEAVQSGVALSVSRGNKTWKVSGL